MNKEELLKDAKLFLGQYAEHLSDTLGYLKSNLERDKSVASKQKGGWYAQMLEERILDREQRKLYLINKLARLDEIRLAI